MTSDELLGKKTLAYENLLQEYDNLLSLVAGIRDGRVAIETLQVDLEKRTWEAEITAAPESTSADTVESEVEPEPAVE